MIKYNNKEIKGRVFECDTSHLATNVMNGFQINQYIIKIIGRDTESQKELLFVGDVFKATNQPLIRYNADDSKIRYIIAKNDIASEAASASRTDTSLANNYSILKDNSNTTKQLVGTFVPDVLEVYTMGCATSGPSFIKVNDTTASIHNVLHISPFDYLKTNFTFTADQASELYINIIPINSNFPLLTWE